MQTDVGHPGQFRRALRGGGHGIYPNIGQMGTRIIPSAVNWLVAYLASENPALGPREVREVRSVGIALSIYARGAPLFG